MNMSKVYSALIIIFVGTSLEWVNQGKGAVLPSWPLNVIIGILYITLLVFLIGITILLLL